MQEATPQGMASSGSNSILIQGQTGAKICTKYLLGVWRRSAHRKLQLALRCSQGAKPETFRLVAGQSYDVYNRCSLSHGKCLAIGTAQELSRASGELLKEGVQFWCFLKN